MVIAACVGEGFSCRVMLLSLSSHWTVAVLSLEIFANMDRKIQAAVELRQAGRGDLTRGEETSPESTTLLRPSNEREGATT